jgi:MFS family permease
MGFLVVGSSGILPQWFSTRRSLAQGIAASGVGVGGLIYNLAANGMIQKLGLEWAWRALAIISCVVNFVCTLLIRDRNKVILPSQYAFDIRLFKRLGFLLILGWGFFSELGYIVLWFSLPAYAASVGLSAQQGSVVGALLNLGSVVGRPVIGYLSDNLGRINIATLTTGWCGLICLVLWTSAKSFSVLCLFAILVGMVCGTFWSTIAPVGAEVVGLGELPSALSVIFIMMVPPATCKDSMTF